VVWFNGRGMVQIQDRRASTVPTAEFTENFVDADGFHIRYVEAGQGKPVVWLHGAGGLHLKNGHHLLAATRRVIGIEMPGFGDSAVNERHQTSREMAATVARAIAALGLDQYVLWGTSFGGRIALWLALETPRAIDKIVLEAPIAILPEGHQPPSASSPEEFVKRFYAHPERMTPSAPPDPALVQKQLGLVMRLIGPAAKDAELEQRMPEIQTPTLVLIGTRDGVVAPEFGREYMRLLPNCNFMLVYDAAHEIASDRPEAFVGTIGDFLERGDAFVVGQRSTVIYP
jgi:pimeloyl-ACP methyl ester carboxylesterase